MTLRPYQSECLDAVTAEYRAGVTRQLIVLPTASGKSVIFREIPRKIKLQKGRSVWLLVHKIELVNQAAKHFRRANPALKVGIERANEFADSDCDVVVAAVQSVGSTGETFKDRLKKFDPARLQAMVIDESHHATSDIFLNVLKYFGLLKDHPRSGSKALLLGVTATPNRSDNVGLSAVFDKIVYSKDIREMINEGWLAPIQAHRVETEIDLSGVKVSHGDFAVKQLEEKVNTVERNKLIVEKYKEIGRGKQAIVFSVDVNHSHNVASEFRRSGISAMPFSGQTPEGERERLLKAHESGEIKVLVSCQALGEGVDMPWAEIGLMARPTKSTLLFTQAVGRLLRPYPAPEEVVAGAAIKKVAAIIVDFVDNSARHSICTIPTLFGLRKEFNPKGASITETLTEIEKAQEKFKQLRLDSFRDLHEMRTMMQAIDLLKPPLRPQELDGMTALTWFSGPGGSYQIVGPMAHFSIRENQLAQFEIAKHEAGIRRVIGAEPTLRQAVVRAEAMIPTQDIILLKSGARWRSEPPTQKQIIALSRLDPKMYARFGKDMGKFTAFVMGSYTKGDLGALITERIASKHDPKKR